MDYTHELVCDDTKYFEDSTKFRDVIAGSFDEIEDIKLVIPTDGGKSLIMVRGRIHLYGFKIEDGGFYDSFNQTYYDEDSPIFKKGIITKCNIKKRILN